MEKDFQKFFENAPVGYFVLNKSTVIKEVNAVGLKYLRALTQNVIDKKLTEFLSESAGDRLSFHLGSIFLTNEPQSCELSISLPNGAKKNVQLSSSLITINNEDFALSVMTDISDLKKNEQDYEHHKRKFLAAVENSNDAILVLDAELNILESNNKTKTIIEYTPDELLKLNISDLIVPEGETDLKIFGQFFKSRKSEGTCFIRNKSNNNFKVNYRIVPRFSNDQHLLFLNLFEDENGGGTAGASAVQSTEIFNDVNFAAAKINKQGSLVYSNNYLLNLIGKQQDQVLNSNWFSEIFDSDFSEQLRTELETALKNGKNLFEFNTDIIFGEKETKNISGSVIIERDSDNEFLGAVLIGLDTSHEKELLKSIEALNQKIESNDEVMKKSEAEISELNAKLIKVKNELKHLSADKDQYLSIIAHDLRSPFSALYGFTEYVYNDFEKLTKDELRDNFNNIYKSAKSMYNLLDNLLQWSRIQSGKIKYESSQINAAKIVNTVLELYKVIAEKKGIEIINNIDENIFVTADETMLEITLRNLLSNAVKFSERNSKVWISSDEEDGEIKFTVEDEGIGIDKDVLPKLFKLHQNKSTPGTEGEEGTGLGLLLCKEFVTKNKGKIWVESKVGTGSSFFFTLPAA
ncbi:MAG: PAS domain S-box protein [Ignavibacteriae bacterium]|nr:PAS domain S-box protein [Ignavibacteriota bacterium]NOH00135.1 PAS domain S-box protein [Ignavibacteriota bacterium]